MFFASDHTVSVASGVHHFIQRKRMMTCFGWNDELVGRFVVYPVSLGACDGSEALPRGLVQIEIQYVQYFRLIDFYLANLLKNRLFMECWGVNRKIHCNQEE